MNKLPDLVVQRVREIYTSGNVSQRKLCERFRLHPSVVSNIVNGHSYKDKYYKPSGGIVKADIEFIKQLRTEKKLSFSKIAELEQIHSGRPFAYSPQHIRRLFTGERGKCHRAKSEDCKV